MVAEDLIAVGYPVMQNVAKSFIGQLPPGLNVDDLYSLGGEQLMLAKAKYDPAGGKPWKGFLIRWLQYAFRSYLQKARRRANRHTELETVMPDGSEQPRPDKKAKNPADAAAGREGKSADRRSMTVAAVKAAMPPADEVAVKAAELRKAMFAAVGPAEMTKLMASMLAAATEDRNVKAAKLLLDVLTPPPPPPPPVINVVLPPCDDADDY